MSLSIAAVSSGLDNYVSELLFKSRFSVLHLPLIKMRVTNENIESHKEKDRQGITSERFRCNSRTLSEVKEVSSMKTKESRIGEQC